MAEQIQGEIHYRPDIDGLRAIAVLSVIAFHGGMLPGGFAGVDIFFVISGYLICQIILKELREERFSIASFYARRVRRILPALFAVLAFTLVFAMFALPPAMTVETARSAIAATLSISNFYFAAHTDYFAAPAESEPLLHTWSLGVEEQFYLAFPVLLIAVHRFAPRHLITLTWFVVAASLATSTYGAFYEDSKAFFSLHNRAWELAVGTLIALKAFGNWQSRWLREFVAWSGLLSIGASLLFLTESMPSPGIFLVPACGGTAALIQAGPGTSVARLLSLRPVVFLGLTSYSLYLWHWPIIVFQRLTWFLYAGENRTIEHLVVVAAIFAISILSWQFIEKPFRARSWKPKRVVLFGGAGAIAILLTGYSATLVWTDGAAGIAPGRIGNFSQFLNYNTALWGDRDCEGEREGTYTLSIDHCLILSAAKKNVLVIGDSHAAGLYPGLKAALPNANVRIVWIPSCRPILAKTAGLRSNCRHMLNDVFGRFYPQHHDVISLVILHGYWKSNDIPLLLETVSELKNKHVPFVVAGPITGYDMPLPRLLDLETKRGDHTIHNRHRDHDAEAIDRKLAQEARQMNFPYVSLRNVFCNSGTCLTAVENVPVQWDAFHLTLQGSKYAGKMVAADLSKHMKSQ